MDIFPVAYWEKGIANDYHYNAMKLNLDVRGYGYKLTRKETKGNNQKGENMSGCLHNDWKNNRCVKCNYKLN
jgi:hypothetical protein